MIARNIPATINSILYPKQISTILSTTAVVNVAVIDAGPKNKNQIFSISDAGVERDCGCPCSLKPL